MPTTVVVVGGLYAPEEVGGPIGLVLNEQRVATVSADLEAAVRLADSAVDLRPWRLAPGYIDLHTHGFRGSDVTSGSEADLKAMAATLPSTGVTAFFPTVASTGPTETARQVERIALAMRQPDPVAAEILGIRLEGPFINPSRKGAQEESAIRRADPMELSRLAGLGPVRMVDFAPEKDAGFALLAVLLRLGILACIGHTNATYEQTLSAIDAGARHCTHLFNAMSPLEHRAPGVAGALLSDARASVEVIADGVHVHPALLHLAVAARGVDAVALVTDAISAAGLGDGEYTFVGRPVAVRGSAVRLADGTLAGSALTMDQAVRNMVSLVGAGWSEAIRMATLTPARIVGISDTKGHLHPGADADFVVLDESGGVRQTWRGGRRVWPSPRVDVAPSGPRAH